ncbi:SDR family oxidoreductase [Paracoccus aestuariivivens]|uniref:NAD-dependent epimerase/dehydratase family protein n=1 Tax=Paracoccus aestuariivivens TaxID=1820333 RepID=A0A6L6J5T8_9RHOB|nr:SDR family oxidoreductase [Paracoccus aestuariivivens]MTH76608.1 NAD-dependent epimerase/dehydratase family protein [Paracoccus aestuariivivens]
MKLLVLGHGYSAGFLTPLLLARGWEVAGTSRSAPERVASLGAIPLLWPGDEPEIRTHIASADAILISAGPEHGHDPAIAAFGDVIACATPRWLGYLSTTGVYGDHAGGWVTEDTPLTPSTRRGHERVAAEAEWQALAAANDLPLHIFRLAGIYGPGRGPFAKVRSGTARRIIKQGQVFSRIHAEDIAQVLMASIRQPRAGAIYNLCDDDPAPPEDVIAHAARLLGLPLPPAEDFATAQMTAMARSFYAESKRVSNQRIKDDLGVTLRYPDYRCGLAALLATET